MQVVTKDMRAQMNPFSGTFDRVGVEGVSFVMDHILRTYGRASKCLSDWTAPKMGSYFMDLNWSGQMVRTSLPRNWTCKLQGLKSQIFGD